ncbi:APC family permease [Adlercreutzia sp. R7]|uniref:APC family permease n=1 Tax=Adlercreutzia wanghongyangiae TaxID=3111451 RepID=A0ABU6IID2_9ACTN|nr:APC family permease [Adlercreutzia sp. R7]
MSAKQQLPAGKQDLFPPQPPDGTTRNLRKTNISALGIAFMLFCLVSAGAFGIEEIIPVAGPGLTLIILIVLPFVWARPISRLVAEANAILPREGGIYAWAKETFGEFWGFQAGWWTSMDTYISSGAYIAMVGGYTSQLLSLDAEGTFVVKLLVVGCFTVVNLVGLLEVERISSFFSVLILIVFGMAVVFGFMNWQTNPFDPIFATPDAPMGCLVQSLSIGIWMYCGYECIAAMSGEYEDSSRNVAHGFRIALPLIALSYILPTLACLAAYPAGSWVMWGIDGGFSADVLGYGTIFSAVLGHSGVVLFLVIAIMSQCTIYNTYLASGSRSFWVLSEDNLFPRFIRKVDKSGRSPFVGVLTIAASSLLFSQFDFTTIIEMNIIFILARYMFLGFIVMRLRKMYPVEERPADMFVIGGGKVGVALYSALAFGIATFTLCLNPVGDFFATVAFLASGVIAYVIFKKMYGGLTRFNPEKHPVDPRTGLAVGDMRRIGLFALIVAGLFALNALMNLLFLG